MHIGELADRTGLSLRTLRHYDEIGILRPSGRTDGGFRVYSEDDFTRLMLIRQARALKFGLDEIGQILTVLSADPGGPAPVDVDVVASLLDEAGRRRARLAADLVRADDLIDDLATRLEPTLGEPEQPAASPAPPAEHDPTTYRPLTRDRRLC